MNRNNFPNYPYYPQTQPALPHTQNTWNNWELQTQQYNNYQRTVAQYPSTVNNTANTRVDPRTQNYYNPHTNTTNRFYSQQRYNASTTNGQYNSGSSTQHWPRNNYYNNNKRHLSESSDTFEGKSKSNKKKKKPLSQNKPSKRDWSLEEAKRALDVEKEYNKRAKNLSLIIKFPDLELSREIVSKFHSAIENVHFQHPSTPRYCFVTLEDSADADAVIQDLNKTKFGPGVLSAEYKRDREEDHNVGPEDIDPLTLYVGNLAQEVTKEDVVKAYPKQRRIDIGYAKKMKYTRYAFVSFKNVVDSIEAFQSTHSTQMYSKSLIVRFRRLHGTVGMPGEAKPQNEPRGREDGSIVSDEECAPMLDNHTSIPAINPPLPVDSCSSIINNVIRNIPPPPPPDYPDNTASTEVDLNLVKQEPSSDDEIEAKLFSGDAFQSPFLAGTLEDAFEKHQLASPIKEEVKIKVEKDQNFFDDTASIGKESKKTEETCTLNLDLSSKDIKSEVKKEVADKDDNEDSSDDDDGEDDDNFDSLLNTMEDRAKKVRSLQMVFQ